MVVVLTFLALLCLFTVKTTAEILNFVESDMVDLNNSCGAETTEYLLQYTKFHADVLNHKEPKRYLVSVAVEAGLADRLSGIITQFWWAVFNKRAFQISTYDRLPRFESAYDYRFINWTRPPDHVNYTIPLMYTYKGERGFVGERLFDDSIDLKEYWLEYLINDDNHVKRIFLHTNVSEYPVAYPTKHTVFTSSNRGGMHYMYDNPKMKPLLEKLNLKKQDSFRCAYTFLFKYNKEVQQTSAPFLKQIEGKQRPTHSNSLLIGIGIRAGDKSFDPKHDAALTPAVYEPFIHCAERIEESFYSNPQRLRLRSNSNTVWFIMAESLHTRQMIAERYGKKVVTDSNNSYFHGDCGHKSHGGCDQEHLRQAIIHAASQLQLFAKCNVHIVAKSGFPRIGAMLSQPPYHIHDSAECRYDHSKPVDKIMSLGAGMRS